MLGELGADLPGFTIVRGGECSGELTCPNHFTNTYVLEHHIIHHEESPGLPPSLKAGTQGTQIHWKPELQRVQGHPRQLNNTPENRRLICKLPAPASVFDQELKGSFIATWCSVLLVL